ncbi:MAG TPA: hypothetical protein VIL85_04915 [Thermomicrobiales bacterium]|jgi:hypothetical protein
MSRLPSTTPATPISSIPKQTCSFEIAARRFGYGKNSAYAALRAGTFPVPVIRSGPQGRVIRVPIKAIDDILGPLPPASATA